MTIIESIKIVLGDKQSGMTANEIYDEIVHRDLYRFGAKNPLGVVNGELRRHCVGLDFPTAYPVKHFIIKGHEGKRIKFALKDSGDEQNPRNIRGIKKDNIEYLPEEKIVEAMYEHIVQIKQQLIDNIISCHPGFLNNWL